jgi:ATP-dependent helicase HrpA
MLTMRLGSVEDFPFVDRPAPRMINDAYQLLFELGALDGEREVTDTGRRLARWPMDVRLARMVEEGATHGCLEDMMVLAAALSIQDPRERPLDAQSAADEAHGRFSDGQSDFVNLLKLWTYLRDLRKSISGNQFRKRCRREFLNWQRVLEWFDLYQQLRDLAREDRLKLSGKHGDYDTVHRCLLPGLLSHCGLKHPEDNSYSGVRSRSFYIFPGSGLFGSKPKWLMAAEIVETTRPYGRINAVIRPEWIEDKGRHLLKRHYFDLTSSSTRPSHEGSSSWKPWSGVNWILVPPSVSTTKRFAPRSRPWKRSAENGTYWRTSRCCSIFSMHAYRNRSPVQNLLKIGLPAWVVQTGNCCTWATMY